MLKTWFACFTCWHWGPGWTLMELGTGWTYEVSWVCPAPFQLLWMLAAVWGLPGTGLGALKKQTCPFSHGMCLTSELSTMKLHRITQNYIPFTLHKTSEKRSSTSLKHGVSRFFVRRLLFRIGTALQDCYEGALALQPVNGNVSEDGDRQVDWQRSGEFTAGAALHQHVFENLSHFVPFCPDFAYIQCLLPVEFRSTANIRNQDSDGLAAQVSQVSVWSTLFAAHQSSMSRNCASVLPAIPVSQICKLRSFSEARGWFKPKTNSN